MKRFFPAVVLLFSLSAAALYVWTSSQKEKVLPAVQDTVDDNTKGDFVNPKIVVTDEEVRASRELMLSSSKSGIIMSEEDVRKMLEEEKKAARDNPNFGVMPDVDDFAPSSKNPGRAISPTELRQQIDSLKQQAQPK